ncbi:hypothetical protein BpHYR1_037047 [Brachionus plicatilis]|uniref:Uncharacterized protein n=1 Tax=Brachionus plicatilis TaxID=10195 RepID=A0A3M7SMT0_BRAPC|nr:hypothetical protein BpHYR1_037047 [Brachionus plicatilis]
MCNELLSLVSMGHNEKILILPELKYPIYEFHKISQLDKKIKVFDNKFSDCQLILAMSKKSNTNNPRTMNFKKYFLFVKTVSFLTRALMKTINERTIAFFFHGLELKKLATLSQSTQLCRLAIA